MDSEDIGRRKTKKGYIFHFHLLPEGRQTLQLRNVKKIEVREEVLMFFLRAQDSRLRVTQGFH